MNNFVVLADMKLNKRTNYKSMLDLIGNTPVVELANTFVKSEVKIFAKLEGQNPTGSVKDRIALQMIEDAEEKEIISEGNIILEPTSGNTGISLALVAKMKGYKVTVVMPDNVSEERTQLLNAYGADIIYTEGKLGTNHSIEVAKDLAAKNSKYVLLYQYGNEGNPKAHYEGTGREILSQVPEVDVFIAGLGTGGTLMGVGKRLKENNPETQIVAVVPEADDYIQGLRRIEDGFIPPILDLSLLNRRVMIKSEEAFKTTKELMDKEGIFAGISCGSVVRCAIKIAQKMEKGNILCLLADGGWKYLSTGLWTKEQKEINKDAKGKIWG